MGYREERGERGRETERDRGREREREIERERERERERGREREWKRVTLGGVKGLGDGDGASLFYFRLKRLCAPFISVAPSLFHPLFSLFSSPHTFFPSFSLNCSVTFFQDLKKIVTVDRDDEKR